MKGSMLDAVYYLKMIGCRVPIKWLGSGYYLFGTLKIYTKVVNEKLVVRVGGGYEGIEEFVRSNEEAEVAKLTTLMEKEGVVYYEDL